MSLLDMIMGKQPNPTGLTPMQQRQAMMGGPAPISTPRGENVQQPSFFERLGSGAMDYLSDPTNRARLAAGFNTMRLNPDPNIAKMAQSQIETAQAMKLLNAQGNKTADRLEAMGYKEEAEFVRQNPSMAKEIASAVFAQRYKKPTETFTTKSGSELGEGYNPNAMYNVSSTGQVSIIGEGKTPQDTFKLLTPEEKTAKGLDPAKMYQVSTQTGRVYGEGGISIGLPSEGERKTGVLANRLQTAQSQIVGALTEDPEAAKPEMFPQMFKNLGLESVARALTSDQRQVIEAAQLDMLDAALTLGTGAAYTKEQLEGYRESYFPQIGDSEQVVQAKKSRLDQLIRTANEAAGRGVITNVGTLGAEKATANGNVVVFPDGTSAVFPDANTAQAAANEFNG